MPWPRRLRGLARPGAIVGLGLVLIAARPCSEESATTGPPDSALEAAARVVGLPASRLEELDRRPLTLAFAPGRYEILVVRELGMTEIVEVPIDLDSLLEVDPEELRRLDREMAAAHGNLTQELRNLLLRHPELQRIVVSLRLSPETRGAGAETPTSVEARLERELSDLEIEASPRFAVDRLTAEMTLSVSEIVRLGSSPLIAEIELMAEPRVLDDVPPDESGP